MKICKKCGAHYPDDKIFCLDCNERLGDKLSASEEQKVRANLNKQMEQMYNKTDPLYVSKFDKTIGALAIVGAVVALVFLIIRHFTEQIIGFLPFAILFFILSALDALIPRLTWGLEKIRLSFFINGADDAEPGTLYLMGRKISFVSMLILGLAALLKSLF